MFNAYTSLCLIPMNHLCVYLSVCFPTHLFNFFYLSILCCTNLGYSKNYIIVCICLSVSFAVCLPVFLPLSLPYTSILKYIFLITPWWRSAQPPPDNGCWPSRHPYPAEYQTFSSVFLGIGCNKDQRNIFRSEFKCQNS